MRLRLFPVRSPSTRQVLQRRVPSPRLAASQKHPPIQNQPAMGADASCVALTSAQAIQVDRRYIPDALGSARLGWRDVLDYRDLTDLIDAGYLVVLFPTPEKFRVILSPVQPSTVPAAFHRSPGVRQRLLTELVVRVGEAINASD